MTNVESSVLLLSCGTLWLWSIYLAFETGREDMVVKWRSILLAIVTFLSLLCIISGAVGIVLTVLVPLLGRTFA